MSANNSGGSEGVDGSHLSPRLGMPLAVSTNGRRIRMRAAQDCTNLRAEQVIGRTVS
jgi:hypothetical protein